VSLQIWGFAKKEWECFACNISLQTSMCAPPWLVYVVLFLSISNNLLFELLLCLVVVLRYHYTFSNLNLQKNLAFIFTKYTQWQCLLSFYNSTAMYKDLKTLTLYTGGIRTGALPFLRQTQWLLCHVVRAYIWSLKSFCTELFYISIKFNLKRKKEPLFFLIIFEDIKYGHVHKNIQRA
jgi:hypothetical protein